MLVVDVRTEVDTVSSDDRIEHTHDHKWQKSLRQWETSSWSLEICRVLYCEREKTHGTNGLILTSIYLPNSKAQFMRCRLHAKPVNIQSANTFQFILRFSYTWKIQAVVCWREHIRCWFLCYYRNFTTVITQLFGKPPVAPAGFRTLPFGWWFWF